MLLLPHLADLGFIVPKDEEGIFMTFPLETRNTMARMLCADLSSGIVPGSHVKTKVHVVTLLEGVGQCFSLPLQFSTTIEAAIALYRSWLLDPQKKPVPIQEDEQFFYQMMLQHLSLIFTPQASAAPITSPRASSSTELTKSSGRESSAPSPADLEQRHIGFCRSALYLYREVGVKYALQLSDETWEILLKIVLGICNSIMTLKQSPELVESLVSESVNILFELWLTSGERPEVMWDTLSEIAKKWKHRLETFSHWSSTCSAINERVLRILFGPSQGTEMIIFTRVDQVTIELMLEDEYVMLAWYRMLHLLGSFEGSVSSARNYFEAMQGISNIAWSYINLTREKFQLAKLEIMPPTGNTVLDICGGWLLEAISNFQKGFDEGKKVALKTLCLLIGSRPPHEFNPNYLAYFYRGIEKALNTHNTALLDAIMRNSTTFFLRQYQASHVLIPAYVMGMERVLFPQAQGSVAKERSVTGGGISESNELGKLRMASFKILSSLLCLPNHYGDTSFNCSSTQSAPLLESLPKLAKFSDLAQHFSEMLLSGIEHELVPENRQYALWAGCVYCFETIDIQSSPQFTPRFVQKLLKALITYKWSHLEILCSLMILRDLSALLPYLNETNVAYDTTMTLCNFIDYRLAELTSFEAENAFTLAVETLLCWVIAGQWILSRSDCLHKVMGTMGKAVTFEYESSLIDRTTGGVVGKRVKASAEYFLSSFINFFGQFPLAAGPDSNSSLRDERALLSDGQGFNLLTLNGHFLSLLPISGREDQTELRCVARDNLGRYIWHNQLQYFIQPLGQAKPLEAVVVPDLSIPLPTAIEETTSAVMERMTDEDKRLYAEIRQMSESFQEREVACLADNPNALDSFEAMQAPSSQKDRSQSAARLFVSTLGLSALPNWTRLLPFQDNHQDKLNVLAGIDKIVTRERFSVGILYFGMDSPLPLFELDSLPCQFEAFIWSIGWRIDIATHAGYKGGLSVSKSGKDTPYWASYNTEVIFQVGPLTPKGEASSNYMQNLIFSNQVLICWTEKLELFDPSRFKLEYQTLFVIEPQPTRLYRLRIFHPSSIASLGPAQDDTILSQQILSTVVRLTALNALRHNSFFGEPPTHRANMAAQVIETHTKPKDLLQFYQSLLAK